MLMEDFGVPAKLRSDVVELIRGIYDGERFAHCLIVQSVRGFFQPHHTRELKYFLQDNGNKRPTGTKERMLSSEEY